MSYKNKIITIIVENTDTGVHNVDTYYSKGIAELLYNKKRLLHNFVKKLIK